LLHIVVNRKMSPPQADPDAALLRRNRSDVVAARE
jgi:hypothetical protein